MLAIANLSVCDSFAPTSSRGAFPSGRPVAAILPRGAPCQRGLAWASLTVKAYIRTERAKPSPCR